MTHIRDLKPDPKNSRRHNPRNVGIVENSIQREGFGRSILIANDGTIIAGNATAEAAASAGLENMIVVESDGTKVIAVKRVDVEPGSDRFHNLAIADNRAAELADWDPAILQSLAAEIDLAQFFRDDELDALLASLNEPVVGLTDPDDVPDVPEVPTTKPGDLWLLGRHRLLCGDATVVTDVERLMDGAEADMVFTDPPYGMDLDTSFKNSLPNPIKSIEASKGYRPVIGDNQDFDPSFLIEYFKSATNQFWWGADYYRAFLPSGGSWLVWDKRDGMDVDWTAAEFELCWSKQKHHRKIIRHRWFGLIGTEQEDQQKRLHPTQKPVGLSADCLNEWSKSDDLIVDLFGGSGWTLIACEQTARRCAMMEIDPHYCDVIVARWQNFTGGTAVLAHDHAMVAD